MTKSNNQTEVVVKKKAKPLQKVRQANRKIIKKAKKIEEKAVESTQKGEVGGFVDFLKAQNVAGLAIGLAVGTAATDTVRKFVQGFVDPLVQLLLGSQESLQQASWHLKLFGRTADFEYGAFVSSMITLLATALVIYAVLRSTGLYKPKEVEDSKKKGK